MGYLKRLKFFLVIACILPLHLEMFSQDMNIIDLNGAWKFRRLGLKGWQNAVVPGCVHLDLMRNNIIPDPFFGENEKDLQWISNTGWEYQKTFYIPDTFFIYRNIGLIFKGLDTYANVYLNDSLILKTDNMFMEWYANIKFYLRPGINTLRIQFPPVNEEIRSRYSKLQFKLPGDEKVVCRKAAYHFGWDWGPTFITSGIWGPVYIRYWNFMTVPGVQYIQKSLTDSVAELSAVFTCLSSLNDTANFRISVNKDLLVDQFYPMKKGVNIIRINFNISNPKKWWCNGLGDPYLYPIEHLVYFGGRPVANDTTRIGLRTLKLVEEKDSVGSGFYFLLNGEKVFIKGANYIPQDVFPSRVTDSSYRALINNVRDANMNMLRVWGGGIYEKEIFYDLCDENGILVWQDFMFACAMYPRERSFIQNAGGEATQVVVRLRNHPCLALWCGNNEIDEGWHNWGWQKQYGYTPEDSVMIYTGYKVLFEAILPQNVARFDSGRSYIPSSPKYGWGQPKSLKEGDVHYWGVWWGKEPFDIYTKKVGRFMSEYGFQGFPDMSTINAFTAPHDRYFGTAVMKAHQKHPTGYETINEYMLRDYKKPLNFEKYIYVSQLLQADGVRTAIEAHRRAKPYCMGTLYWQLNDCWPVVSWSSQDYYGRKKAVQYQVKKAYDKFLVSPVTENGKIKVYVISDDLKPRSGDLSLKLMDFSGNVAWQRLFRIEIPANSSQIYFDSIMTIATPENMVLSAKLTTGPESIAGNLLYFKSPKDLALVKPEIKSRVSEVPEGYAVEITTDKLAKNIFLRAAVEGEFSDNYFDLLPGESKKIFFRTNQRNLDLSAMLKIQSLVDSY